MWNKPSSNIKIKNASSHTLEKNNNNNQLFTYYIYIYIYLRIIYIIFSFFWEWIYIIFSIQESWREKNNNELSTLYFQYKNPISTYSISFNFLFCNLHYLTSLLFYKALTTPFCFLGQMFELTTFHFFVFVF